MAGNGSHKLQIQLKEGKMKRTGNFGKVLVFIIGLTIVSFMVGPSYAKELMPLKVSYLPIMDLLQFYVASEKGFFEEEGLKVEGQKATGGAVSQTLVESGSVDLGWTAIVPFSQAYVKGFEFVFIAPGAFMDRTNRRFCSVVVKNDSPYKSIKDLAGKKIAVNGINSINHLSILTIADFHGVDGKGLKFLEVPFPNQPVALKEGAVDAASMLEPFITISEGEGITREIFNGFYPPEVIERYMVAGWFAKKSALEKDKDKIGRFLKAINKATDFINKNPDQLPDIISKNTKLDVNVVRKVTLPKYFTKLSIKDIQPQIDLCVKYGFIQKGFNAKEIISDLIPRD
jgi:NitT/TauT family transport system substrate-binding protein